MDDWMSFCKYSIILKKLKIITKTVFLCRLEHGWTCEDEIHTDFLCALTPIPDMRPASYMLTVLDSLLGH
jgi:hypothetical protein